MAYDVLIKGGRIYDGSGMPSYLGDVAVKDGRIVETGRINGSAKRMIHADGLGRVAGVYRFSHPSRRATIVGSAGNVLLLSRRHHCYSRQLRLSFAPCKEPDRTRF